MVLLAVRRVTTVCVTASTLSPLTSHTACTQARRQLLAEMCDPQVRVWLIYLAAYGKASVQPFLSYTQNDNLGVAFKAPRVIRDRISFLDDIASEEKDPLLHAALTELNTFVKERAASFPDVNSVRSLVRNAAAAASRYFQGEDGAASTPRKQRALRWLKHPPLLLLGLMDEKGHAVQTAKELVRMAAQGTKGLVREMLPYMPDGLTAPELLKAIAGANDGPCVAFQSDSLAMIRKLATMSAKTKLADLSEAQPLHALLKRVGSTVPVGNFISETVVKHLSHDLSGAQRRTSSYATMLVAARARPQRWPISEADLQRAAAEQRRRDSERRLTNRSIGPQLQSIDVTSAPPDLSNMLSVLDVQDPGEGEGDDDEDDDGDDGDDDGGEGEGDGDGKSGGDGDGGEMSAVLPVKLAEVRRVLAEDTVIKVLWQMSPEGVVDIWPALLVKKLVNVVRVRWLRWLDRGVLIINEAYTEESWAMDYC